MSFISAICLIIPNLGFASNTQIKITKFDTQHKGIADLVLFEKPDITIAVMLDGSKIVRYEVSKTYSGKTAIVKYKRSANSLIASYGFATADRYFYNRDNCTNKSAETTIEDNFSSLLGATETKTIVFDQSCNSHSILQGQISKEFDYLLDKNTQSKIGECLRKFDTIATQKWLSLPNSLTKISCDNDSVNYNGIYDSKKNEIRISNKCVKSDIDLSSTLKEEMLHSFGVKDEALAKCLAKCPNTSAFQSCEDLLKKNKLAQQIAGSEYTILAITNADGTISDKTVDDYNSAKTIEVPREIAVSQVPQPAIADLKMSQSVETSTVADNSGTSAIGSGSASASASSGRSYSSASYPSSMMQFAASAVLPDRAFAQGSGSSSSSPSSRSSANYAPSNGDSSEALRHSAATRVPASDSSAVAPNYSKPASLVDGDDDKSAASNKETGKSISAKAARSNSGRVGSSGNDGGGNSSSGAGSSSSSGASNVANSGGANSSARSPASVKFKSSSEIAQYFQSAPYNEIKQRLRDPQFAQDLQKNSMTVFDTQGHRFGAPQGQIIYSDKGNRFVKEK